MLLKKLNDYFELHAGFGIVFLRLIAAWRLIAGVISYSFFVKPMNEVAIFFEQLHIPFPMFSASLSVYAQLICGVLFLFGLWVRPAAIVMILNFGVAIIAAHTHDSIEKSFSAWALLMISVCLLFTGSGKFGFDNFGKTVKQSGCVK